MFKKSIRFVPKYYLKRNVTCVPTQPCDPSTCITILPNGVRIATEYQPTEISCMSLFVEAGPRYEIACNNGIMHFIEHIAYRGYGDINKVAFEMAVRQIGAKMTAKTSREIQSFTGIFLSDTAPEIFNYLAAIITNMELSDSDVEDAKRNICLEMADEDRDLRALTFDYLHKTAFQGTSLAQPVIGPTKNLDKFDREYAMKFLRYHYQPYKLCVCTSGRVDHENVVNWACAKLGDLVGESNSVSHDGPSRFSGSQVLYRDDAMPFAHVAIAFEAPGYTNPEYWQYLVATHILGSWHISQEGKIANCSYLARAASCAEICDSFESFYITYRDVGLWGMYFVSKRMSVEDMVESIQRQWMNLCLVPQPSDTARALNSLKLKLASDVTGVIKSCHDIGVQMMYACTRRSLEEKLCALATVRPENINDCIERMMYDRCPAVAGVGPTEGVPDYNRIRAGQYWLRL